MKLALPKELRGKHIELAAVIVGALVLFYLHKRGAFYGETVAAGGMGDMMGMGPFMGAAPTMDVGKFENCVNAGIDIAACTKQFGGGNKVEGGVVDTQGLEDCINMMIDPAKCLNMNRFGQGNAGVNQMMDMMMQMNNQNQNQKQGNVKQGGGRGGGGRGGGGGGAG